MTSGAAMPKDFYALNGRIVPAEEARISVLDLGFLRGVGAFETLRTYGGYPHALGDHLRRLWATAAAFGLAPFFDERDVRRAIAEILTRSGHPELRVNIVVTPGENLAGVFEARNPTWVLIARDVHALPESVYRDGVSVVTFESQRLWPAHKTTTYLSGKSGVSAAERAGAHEALYVSAEGYVSEGVTSNVLIIRGTRLFTPVADCLAGITKAGIRPLAEAEGLSWNECRLTRDDLYFADEVWITSSVRELVPVVKVDERTIACGKPGPWATKLRGIYHRACVDQALREAGATARSK
jgi:branched-chain amino acid aminotransferase